MNSTQSLNQPDQDFLAFASSIETVCTANATAWDLDSERLITFREHLASATAAFEKNNDKATRNHATATHKKATFGELKHFLSPYINYLESNLNVPDEALALMNLRPRTHTANQPKPRPVEIPLLKVLKQHDELTIYVTRAEYGHPTQSTKRDSYAGFKLRWRFEDDPPAYLHTEISTRLHHTLYFNREDEARRVILAVAWVNPRLEEGPWTEDLTEVIG
jgi:hypothetical protein